MHPFEIALCAGVAAPLGMFAVLAFFGARIGKPLAGWCAVLAVGVSFGMAAYVASGWLGMSQQARGDLANLAFSFKWLDLTVAGISVPVLFKLKLDSLTIMMYLMVTLVSTCIFVFSVGYMAGHSDEVDHVSKYHRFFAYLCLFEFSMLGLLISSSLFFLFVFWELVGLCSYLLIGFYFDRKYASNAAIKAFVTNRVGDFGFLAGLMLVFVFLRTLDLDEAAVAFRHQYETHTGIFAAVVTLFGYKISGMALATLMGIGLFCGAIGKSAQFPLHVWLPDAMAGPTPVSALIHAATMVAAGVYLVARIFRLLTPDAQFVIAVIGCITLTMTALIAIVQTDIKKVLAYSTLSQLGYMIFGLGIGAWVGALFHLITHAFFKAMLFLGSGQVIEGAHHEQDIRKMGGLWRKMPVTCLTFFIGVLAIAGFGIPGAHLGLGGYFSKDEILAVAYERAFNWQGRFGGHHESNEHAARGELAVPIVLAAGQHGDAPATHEQPADQHGHADSSAEHHAAAGHGHDDPAKAKIAGMNRPLPRLMFWLPILIAYITPFYMMRVWWLTFMGKPRDHHVYDHAHESPLMYVPLVVLAIGTVIASYWLFRPSIVDAGVHAANATLVVAVDGENGAANMLGLTHEPASSSPHHALINLVGFSWVVGMGLAALLYFRGLGLPERIRRLPLIRSIHTVLEQKFFFDHLYEGVLVNFVKTIVAGLCRAVDTYIVDTAVNMIAALTVRLAYFSGRTLDTAGVDGVVDGLADTAKSLGDVIRQPHTGRIRNYVLFGTAGAALVLVAFAILAWW